MAANLGQLLPDRCHKHFYQAHVMVIIDTPIISVDKAAFTNCPAMEEMFHAWYSRWWSGYDRYMQYCR